MVFLVYMKKYQFTLTGNIIRFTLILISSTLFCIQSCLNSFWHRFSKVQETFIRDSDSITSLLRIYQLGIHDANLTLHHIPKVLCWNQKKDMVSQYSGWLWPLNDGTKGSKSKQMHKHIQILLMFLLGCKQIKTVYLKSLRFFFIFSPHQSSLSIIPQHNIDRIKMA